MTQLVDRNAPVRRPRSRLGYAPGNIVRWIAATVRAPRPPACHANVVPAWRRYAFHLAAALMLIAMSMLWLDAPAIELARKLPPEVRAFFSWFTQFGRSHWVLVPLGVLFLATAVACRPSLPGGTELTLTALAARLGFLFAAIALPGLVSTLIKNVVGRTRPSMLGPYAYDPLSWTYAHASFPSGHACTAFGMLVAFGAMFPKLRLPLWIFALLIAFSRIAVASHYPSDALAGAVLGAFGAVLVRDWFAHRRLAFFVAPGGEVRAGTHPNLARLKGVARRLFAP